MSIETAIAWLLSGGGIAAIVTLWTTRHKPQVDKNAQATDAASKANTALSTTLDQIQEERKTEREEWRLERAEMRERMAAQDSKIAALTGRVDEAEADAREAKTMTTFAVAENANLVGYIIATAEGIAARRVPPWIDPAAYGLHGRLSLDDLPVIHRHHDTGVPGVDLNPPPEPED